MRGQGLHDQQGWPLGGVGLAPLSMGAGAEVLSGEKLGDGLNVTEGTRFSWKETGVAGAAVGAHMQFRDQRTAVSAYAAPAVNLECCMCFTHGPSPRGLQLGDRAGGPPAHGPAGRTGCRWGSSALAIHRLLLSTAPAATQVGQVAFPR